ncbi:pentapeptide repeat-containing protein, partial [Lentzea sp. NPDC058450]|uniref:pentapeptide repeat-containing protein n=1 Tax=Lentzea sp. NPDC058450 TaxID=3346505 RepID=UPI003666C1AB
MSEQIRLWAEVVLAASVAIGVAVGIYSLRLFILRQRFVEAQAEHERIDARERRLNELYAGATGQLGNEVAAVRLAGVYALERLALEVPDMRQVIVNVLCAYLRMPFTRETPSQLPEVDSPQRNELSVRLTVQRVLARHLRKSSGIAGSEAWLGIDLDLTGAFLVDIDFSDCEFRSVDFARATFVGSARFEHISIAGNASFEGCRFENSAYFDSCSFEGACTFLDANFARLASFSDMRAGGLVVFDGANFAQNADFSDGAFFSEVSLRGVNFSWDAFFLRVRFVSDVIFDGSNFSRDAIFDAAAFIASASFEGCAFNGRLSLIGVEFDGTLASSSSIDAFGSLGRMDPDEAARVGSSLLERYFDAGLQPDLDRAIGVLESAAELTASGSAERAGRLSNLGIALRARFEYSHDPGDLDRAIGVLESAAELTASGSAERAGRLSNLG